MKTRNELVAGRLGGWGSSAMMFGLGYLLLSNCSGTVARGIAMAVLAAGLLAMLGRRFLRWRSGRD